MDQDLGQVRDVLSFRTSPSTISRPAPASCFKLLDVLKDCTELLGNNLFKGIDGYFGIEWFIVFVKESPDAMKNILHRDDPSLSVIAAFALTLHRHGGQALIDAYDKSQNGEVQWGITDAISTWEASWVHEHVVSQWIATTQVEAIEKSETGVRAAHICYLIQKNCLADDTARAFLGSCLLRGSPRLQGRAIRAFGKLQEANVEKWLRPLCEQVLRRQLDIIDQSRMQLGKTDLANPDLQRAAMEALRDIGDAGSISQIV